MNNREIAIVGYVYILICLAVFFTFINIEHKRTINSLNIHKEQLFEAKKLVIELADENDALYGAVDGLNTYINKMDKLDRLIQDLESIPRKERNKTLANCYNETNLTYGAVHKGPYDKTTIGICGVKTAWIDVIPELTDHNIDSLYGGYLVLSHLEKQEGSYIKGLQKYKGSIKNQAPVQHVLKLENLIKGS